MELTEDQLIETYAKRCVHFTRNTLLPYENECTCITCGYNVKKNKKMIYEKKNENFIGRLKYAQKKKRYVFV